MKDDLDFGFLYPVGGYTEEISLGVTHPIGQEVCQVGWRFGVYESEQTYRLKLVGKTRMENLYLLWDSVSPTDGAFMKNLMLKRAEFLNKIRTQILWCFFNEDQDMLDILLEGYPFFEEMEKYRRFKYYT